MLLLLIACNDGELHTSVPTPSGTPTATSANLRVAFVGDQGMNQNSRRVLQLIRNERAELLVVLGDFDYEDFPVGWDAMLSDELGASFPILAAVGNHDVGQWDGYKHLLTERLARTPEVKCDGDYGVNAACKFKGLFIILSGAGTLGKDHAQYALDGLTGDNSIWSVCAWHKNQTRLQTGDKTNEVGWAIYEACASQDAIIATGHEHSYQRTKTLRDVRRQVIDPEWTDGKSLRVGEGSTFVFVSGLGGREVRPQARCNPSRPPYGCGFEWASIYTSSQDATYGALFIDFNVDGDARRARGYFKNIRGEVIDEFTVTATP